MCRQPPPPHPSPHLPLRGSLALDSSSHSSFCFSSRLFDFIRLRFTIILSFIPTQWMPHLHEFYQWIFKFTLTWVFWVNVGHFKHLPFCVLCYLCQMIFSFTIKHWRADSWVTRVEPHKVWLDLRNQTSLIMEFGSAHRTTSNQILPDWTESNPRYSFGSSTALCPSLTFFCLSCCDLAYLPFFYKNENKILSRGLDML